MRTVPPWLMSVALLGALGALHAVSIQYLPVSENDPSSIWTQRIARALIQLCAAVLAVHALQYAIVPLCSNLASVTDNTVDDRAVLILTEELRLAPLQSDSPVSENNPEQYVSRWTPAYVAHCYLLACVTAAPLGLQDLFFYQFAHGLFWVVCSWRCLTVVWRLLALVCTDVLASSNLAKSQNFDGRSVEKLLHILQPVYWALAGLLVCENLGINVTSVATGMGIGGVAVAFSAQQILQDLLAAFTMLIDGTVRRGDFVVLAGSDVSGSVVSCGWKSTRIQSPSGHLSVLANHDICTARIKKFDAIQNRLDTLVINVDLETKLECLLRVIELLRSAVQAVSHPKCQLQDVYLKRFDTAAHVFEVVVQFNETSLNEYRQCLSDVNMQIAKVFAENNVSFAVPYMLKLAEKRS